MPANHNRVLTRVDDLIAKADSVLATHQPSPRGAVGYTTLSQGAFAEWREQAFAFLQSTLGAKHAYTRGFDSKVHMAYYAQVSAGRGILRAFREDLAAGNVDDYAPADALTRVTLLCSRFHIVAAQIRSRYDGRPTLDVADEYDVQDLLHAMLRIHFEDVRVEEWTPSYAGKCARMDFLLKGEDIVIEVKKTRAGLGAKELGSQLLEDIGRYQAHPECKTLFCFVYDPDRRVANPRGLERDLSRDGGALCVRVLIAPSGH